MKQTLSYSLPPLGANDDGANDDGTTADHPDIDYDGDSDLEQEGTDMGGGAGATDGADAGAGAGTGAADETRLLSSVATGQKVMMVPSPDGTTWQLA